MRVMDLITDADTVWAGVEDRGEDSGPDAAGAVDMEEVLGGKAPTLLPEGGMGLPIMPPMEAPTL